MTDPRIEIRATSAAPAMSDTGRRITGHFARFGSFNEINGIEGRFLERIAPGAFKKTLAEQGDRIRMLFQHGHDPEIGDKPIGAPDVLREDEIGPYFEGDLFDAVPALVREGLRKRQYGLSYRFSIVNPDNGGEHWEQNPKPSDINPEGLPERTIREARVYEFGPVTFPADVHADYAVRSISPADLDALGRQPDRALSDDAGAPPHVPESRPEPQPVAPSADAGATHVEPERREPDPPASYPRISRAAFLARLERNP